MPCWCHINHNTRVTTQPKVAQPALAALLFHVRASAAAEESTLPTQLLSCHSISFYAMQARRLLNLDRVEKWFARAFTKELRPAAVAVTINSPGQRGGRAVRCWHITWHYLLGGFAGLPAGPLIRWPDNSIPLHLPLQAGLQPRLI